MLSRSTSWKRCSPDLPVHYYASLDNLLDFKDDFYSLHCLFVVVVGKFLSFGNNFIFNAACREFFSEKIFYRISCQENLSHRWNLKDFILKRYFSQTFFPSPKSLPTSGDDEIFFPCQWTFFFGLVLCFLSRLSTLESQDCLFPPVWFGCNGDSEMKMDLIAVGIKENYGFRGVSEKYYKL